MSKALFTCALVVNLLIVSCAAASVTAPTPTQNEGIGVVLARIMARRETIVETMNELIDEFKSLYHAILRGSCGRLEQMAMEMLGETLKNLVPLLSINGQERFYMIPASLIPTTPITEIHLLKPKTKRNLTRK